MFHAAIVLHVTILKWTETFQTHECFTFLVGMAENTDILFFKLRVCDVSVPHSRSRIKYPEICTFSDGSLIWNVRTQQHNMSSLQRVHKE